LVLLSVSAPLREIISSYEEILRREEKME